MDLDGFKTHPSSNIIFFMRPVPYCKGELPMHTIASTPYVTAIFLNALAKKGNDRDENWNSLALSKWTASTNGPETKPSSQIDE